jgi:hypothetical protein
MGVDEILAWVDRRLEAKKLTAAKASRLAGHPYLIQNMRKTARNGHGSLPKTQSLHDLAKVLEDPPAGLLQPFASSDLEMLEKELVEIDRRRERLITAIAVIKETRDAG